MKKIIKMSLVAAAAVSSLSSSASASLIEEISDKVNVFGYAQIRYDKNNSESYNSNTTKESNTYTHKTVLGATGKLNDDLSFMFAGTAFAGEPTTGPTNYSSLLLVYNYFTYTGIENTAVTVGRQGLDTPLTVVYDPADVTSEATGVSVTTKLAGVTLNAARFSSTIFNASSRYNKPGVAITGGETYTHVGISGKVADISLDAWYADMEDTYDTVTVGASTKIMSDDLSISPYARYTTADIDDVDADQNLWKLGVDAKMGIFGAGIAYGQTDEEGGWVTFDKDAAANLQGWNVSLLGNADADLVKLNVNVDVLSNLNLGIHYTSMDVADDDASEIYAKAKYQMSPNFSSTLKIGQVEVLDSSEKVDVARLELLWLF
jgi:hypothetical protein